MTIYGYARVSTDGQSSASQALLAEIRAAQEELGTRIDRRAGCALRENAGGKSDMASSTAEPAAFAAGSAPFARAASRVRRIGGPSGVTRSGSGCRQNSIRTSR